MKSIVLSMVILGVIKTAVLSATIVALVSQVAGAQPQPRHFEARQGDVVIDVTLSDQPVSMRSFTNRDWRSDTAPVIVRILRRGLPEVTMWATPSYGDIDLPGRHVNVTYLTRYRAAGDSADAEPLYSGIPIKPDARKRDGITPMEMPLLNVAHLEVFLSVRNGRAATILRNAKDPSKSVIFTRI